MRAKFINEEFSRGEDVKKSLRIGKYAKYSKIWEDVVKDESGDPGYDIDYKVIDNDYDPRYNPQILKKVDELMEKGELFDKKIVTPNEDPAWEESIVLYITDKGPIFRIPFDYGYTYGTTMEAYPEMWKYLTDGLDPAEISDWDYDDEDEEDE